MKRWFRNLIEELKPDDLRGLSDAELAELRTIRRIEKARRAK